MICHRVSHHVCNMQAVYVYYQAADAIVLSNHAF
jgi:hypothetical protein